MISGKPETQNTPLRPLLTLLQCNRRLNGINLGQESLIANLRPGNQRDEGADVLARPTSGRRALSSSSGRLRCHRVPRSTFGVRRSAFGVLRMTTETETERREEEAERNRRGEAHRSAASVTRRAAEVRARPVTARGVVDGHVTGSGSSSRCGEGRDSLP